MHSERKDYRLFIPSLPKIVLVTLNHISVLFLFQTVVRMNKLQICVSAESTLQKVDECAQGYDTKLTQWIASQMEYLNGKNPTNTCYVTF